MASITKRGNNSYRITVSNGYDREGKKIIELKTVTIDDTLTPAQVKKELNRIAQEFEARVKRGDIIDSAITFEEFTKRWLCDHAEKNLEKSTVESYKLELNTKILPAIGHVKLSELKPLHLIKFYDKLTRDGIRLDNKEGGYSTRIIKYQHAIISTILQTAVYWQALNNNVAQNVKVPKGNDKRKDENFLDDEQTREFLVYILANEPLIYQALAFVAAYGGLRRGELLALTWNDVDFVNNRITIDKTLARAKNEIFIKDPKNKTSTRTVSLPLSVMALLKMLKLSANETTVFPMSFFTPSHWFKRTKDKFNANAESSGKTKIPEGVTFHGLRHTSATLLIMQGLDIKTISARLGHADTTTTLNVYAHAIKSRDEVASNALETLLDIKTIK